MLRITLTVAASAAVLTCSSAASVQARDYSINSMRIMNPWSRATAAAGASAVGYMTLTNDGSKPDRLTAASCPVARSTELHSDTNVNGVMRMRPVDGIDIAPGQTVKLTPNGLHFMLMGTKERLARGSSFSCTLQFQDAGPVDIELVVRGAGATEQLMGPMEMK
jgi:copper(I)-binding protein